MRSYRTLPVLVAIVACLYILGAEYGLTPLTERGWHQSTLGWFIGLGRLIELPGFVVADHFNLNVEHHPALTTWLVIFAVDIPLYLIATYLGERLLRNASDPNIHRPVAKAALTPSPLERSSNLPSRRQFLVAGNRIALEARWR